MLIFDEKDYAKNIIKNKKYNTIKNQGEERSVVVKYLLNEGCDDVEIINELYKIPLDNAFLTDEQKKVIFNKIIQKVVGHQLIFDIQVDVYEEEMDIILNLDEDLRFLSFVFLVIYKWSKNVDYKIVKRYPEYVFYKEQDIWDLAKIKSINKTQRMLMSNRLFLAGYLHVNMYNRQNAFSLPWLEKIDNDKNILSIKGEEKYNNLYNEFQLLVKNHEFASCCDCGFAFKKNSNRQIRCKRCFRQANVDKVKKSQKSRKSSGRNTKNKKVNNVLLNVSLKEKRRKIDIVKKNKWKVNKIYQPLDDKFMKFISKFRDNNNFKEFFYISVYYKFMVDMQWDIVDGFIPLEDNTIIFKKIKKYICKYDWKNYLMIKNIGNVLYLSIPDLDYITDYDTTCVNIESFDDLSTLWIEIFDKTHTFNR